MLMKAKVIMATFTKQRTGFTLEKRRRELTNISPMENTIDTQQMNTHISEKSELQSTDMSISQARAKSTSRNY